MGKSFNPWPVGVVLVYGSFAAVMIGFVVWSTGQKVDLVAPDYYAQELAYQQEIDALERSAPYRDQIQWNLPDGALEIAVADPLREMLTGGILRYYRPSVSGLDHDVELALDGDGRFLLDVSSLQKGFWRARVEWQKEGLDYALETSLFF